jgi:hypothetical protein
MVDCEQPTRTSTKLRFSQFQRFILSRLTVGAQIRHGNPPFLRLTGEFEGSEKPATSSLRKPGGGARTAKAAGRVVLAEVHVYDKSARTVRKIVVQR